MLLACAETFRSFTACHLATVLVCAAAAVAFIAIGRRAQTAASPAREFRVRWVWAGLIVIGQILTILFWISPGRFELDKSLPLHICDLAPWAAVAALLGGPRWTRTLTYFWGIGLCTQAFFTPIVEEGWAKPQFWFFWIQHTQIVASAAYLLVVSGYRPNWRDFGVTSAISIAYVLVMMAFNQWQDVNYGYVGGRSPDVRTVIDALGPWPLRVLWLALIVEGVFALLVLVWRLPRPSADRKGSEVEPGADQPAGG